MRLPLRYEVLPQIKVQTPTPMARTGAEPAPSQSLTVMAPTAAGTLTLTSLGDPSAISVELQGDRLVVKTRQVRAGIYKTVATLEGSGDSRFKVPVELLYVVNPPPVGEQPLAVTPNRIDLGQIQGTQTIHRFRIRRPTWTDALDSVRISSSDFDVVKNLRALGNDEYEFTVDTSNLSEGAPPGSGQSGYFSSILIDAGELGGTAGVSVSVSQIRNPAAIG